MMLDDLVKVPPPTTQQEDRMLSAIHSRLDEMARSKARAQQFWGVAAVTVVLGVGAAQMLIKPQDAFASWTPTPEGFQISAGSGEFARCASQAPPLPPGVSSATTSKPVLAEKRGVFTAALLVDSTTTTLCIHGDQTRGAGRVPRVAVPEGSSVAVEANGGSQDAGDVRYVFGTASDEVEEVLVHLSSGDDVTASLSGGQFLAWWPSGREPVSIEARRSAGSLQHLTLQDQN